LYPAYGYTTHWITNVGGALHWATDTRDPFDSCHDYLGFGYGTSIAEHFGVPGGDIENKGISNYRAKMNLYDRTEYLTAWVQNHQSLKNSLPLCEYASLPATYYHPPDMDIRIFESKILSAVTGIDYDVERLWEAGERIWNLRRAIMVFREKRERKSDSIGPAWFERTVGGTSSLAAPLDRKQWNDLITRYYELRGWDAKSGKPMKAKLEALGMKNVATRLG
jgi:aldehyde:ferredoxin oxidoreductase